MPWGRFRTAQGRDHCVKCDEPGSLDLDKDGLPNGYFTEEDILAYRSLVEKVPDGG